MIPEGQEGHYSLINQAFQNSGLKVEFDREIAYRHDTCIKAIKAKDFREAEVMSDVAVAFEQFWERLGLISEEVKLAAADQICNNNSSSSENQPDEIEQ